MVTHTGGCHCGRVRFEVRAPAKIQALECNCSICTKAAFLHLVVPEEHFRLVAGRESLCVYTFHSRTAKHLFCSCCGVKSFYIPRADPGSRSVNVRCLEPGTVEEVTVARFEGRSWGAGRRYSP